jgi:hypothetical protein
MLNVRCLPAFGSARGDQGSMFKLLHLKLRSVAATRNFLTGLQLDQFPFQVRPSAKSAEGTITSNHSVAGYQDGKGVVG